MVARLVLLLEKKGVKHFVISPGSRNAPLINALTDNKRLQCYSMVDERSAAYYALGMSVKLQQPVALVCTSGTAMLNYAPAMAEAFYQQIPLVAITADRPEEYIDQREGQAIRQQEAYRNFVKKSIQLPQEPLDADRIWYGERIISETLNMATLAPQGPVHINVPLREPLYEKQEHTYPVKEICIAEVEKTLSEQALTELAAIWEKHKKVMILTGVLSPNAKLSQVVSEFAARDEVVVLSERTSNIQGEKIHQRIDCLLNVMDDSEKEYLSPDLLITIGNDVVSKQIKAYLRKYKPEAHWHIDEGAQHTDTYKSLTHIIPLKAEAFLFSLSGKLPVQRSDYSERWMKAEERAQKKHNDSMPQVPWSDLKVFETICAEMVDNSVVHLGNSSPVRYTMLFPPKPSVVYFSNRGTSGIDGIVSTAAGYAMHSDVINTVIVGDVSFYYDSNALWNNYLPKNLRIVVINNQGGNIFRIIPGPKSTGKLEEYFQTKQDFYPDKVADLYNLDYFVCDEQDDLEGVLKKVYEPNDKAVVLEIRTTGEINDTVLKTYFEYLKRK